MAKITLKNVRLAFPNLFEAKAVNAGDTPRFGASFILAKTHPQFAELQEACDGVANDKWGAKAPAVIKELKAKDRVAFRDGDGKASYAGFEGNWYVAAGNPTRPRVLDRDKTPLVAQDGKPYSGCYVNAVLEVWAQDNSYGKRVNATLMGVQFVKDGEAFTGGGVASEDDFDELSLEEEDDLA